MRWNILRLCASRSRTQTELRATLGVSSSVLCRHIHILKRAGLVESTRWGRTRKVSTTPSAREMLERSLPLHDAHRT
ncbi:ArsR/SmtB family transcription factor [Corynebacterium timonense]|uniref:ArsR/SmtB family transcription factor n=1 Tax=Corynebacterium timonense TaxID=441500 RepID=UPI0038B3CFAF